VLERAKTVHASERAATVIGRTEQIAVINIADVSVNGMQNI
jgi:hypothetical protein